MSNTSDNTHPSIRNMIITISQPQEDSQQYMIQVKTSAGNAFSSFTLPEGWNSKSISETLKQFRHNVSTDRYITMRGESTKDSPPRLFGQSLFKTIFQGRVEDLYRKSLAEARKKTGSLPLRFNIAPKELAKLPWEFLFDPQEAIETGYLSLGEETPVIRCFDRKVEPGMLDLPLRVFLVSASPSNYPTLKLTQEYSVIDKAIKSLPPEKYNIEYLFGATIESFTERIRNFKPHIVHFMGHGNVQQLLMQDGETFRSESLAITLKNNPSLRLVVLNACQAGGVIESVNSSEIQFGVAQSLAKSGVPAVAAMQFPISDTAATIFAAEFYKVLVERGSVDQAVTWARIAMQTRLPSGSMEWATPVLYLQTESGLLFDGLFKQAASETDFEQAVEEEPVSDNQRNFDMAQTQARIQHIEELLKTRARNLEILESQAAKHGTINVPLGLQNQIEDEKKAIEKLQKERFDLRAELGEVTKPKRPSTAGEEATPDSASRKPSPTDKDKRAEEKRLQLETLLQDGKRFYEKNDWEKAVHFLKLASDIDNTDRNVADLLDSAGKKLAEQRNQRGNLSRLETLFNQAVQHLEAEPPRFRDAIGLLEFIKKEDVTFKSAELTRLLQQAETGYQQLFQADVQQIQYESFYQRAVEELDRRQWDQAIYLLEELGRLSAPQGYKDAADLLKEARRRRLLSETCAKGQAAFEERRWSEAKIHFGQVCAWDPNDQDAAAKLAIAEKEETLDSRYRAGLDFIEAERWREAIEALEPIAETDPHRPLAKQARPYAEARLYMQNRDWEKAITLLEPLANVNYRDAITHRQTAQNEKNWAKVFAEGEVAFTQRRWETAINAFRFITDQNPDYKDGEAQKQLDLALEEAELHRLYTIATHRLTEKNWDQAIKFFDQILQIRPSYLDARLLLKRVENDKRCFRLFDQGKLAFNRGDFQDAVHRFEELRGCSPDYRPEEVSSLLADANRRLNWKEKYQLGQRAINDKKWPAALAHLKDVGDDFNDVAGLRAIAGRQMRLSQLYGAGKDHLEAGRWNEAISTFKDLQTDLKKDPDLERDNDYADTPARLREAEHQKKLADLYKEAGEFYDNRQWAQALNTLTTLLKVNSGSDYKQAKVWLANSKTELAFERAFAEGKQAFEEQEWLGAIAALKTALSAKPNHPEAQRMKQQAENSRDIQAFMQQGQQFEDAGRWQEAAQAYQKILSQFDQTHSEAIEKRNHAERMHQLTSLMERANLSITQQKWPEAIDLLQEFILIDDKNEDVKRKLSEIRVENDLAKKYHSAGQALQNGIKNYDRAELQKAISLFEQIIMIRPGGYIETADQLARGREELQLLDDYTTVEILLKGEDWEKALEKLDQITRRRADYREVQRHLQEAKLNQADKIHWDKADELLKPNKPEPEMLEKARHELQIILDSGDSVYNPKAKAPIEEIQGQLQQYLQTCYDQMLAHAKAEEWELALGKLEEISKVDPIFNNAPDKLTEVMRTAVNKYRPENPRKALEIFVLSEKITKLTKFNTNN